MPVLTFTAATRLAASADIVFAWHEEPEAFDRLTPPWASVRVLKRRGGIRDGAQVLLRLGPSPLGIRWHLRHVEYQRGRSFTDVQVTGPFRSWRHVHRITPEGTQASLLEDHITYEMPLGRLGWLVGRLIVQRQLMRLFAFRHAVTRRALSSSTAVSSDPTVPTDGPALPSTKG
jgi:ligand-binding SRPBCC domain-containing protein